MNEQPTAWAVPPEFAVTSHRLDDGGFVVAVTGELDLYTAPELERALLGADGATSTTVDLSATTFVDSTALHVLVTASRRVEGSFVVVAPDPNVRKIFEITGLDRVLTLAAGAQACPG